jgi:hypothetical protein
MNTMFPLHDLASVAGIDLNPSIIQETDYPFSNDERRETWVV